MALRRIISEPTTRIHEPLSWDVLCRYEPRLLNIVRRINAIKDTNEQRKGTRKLRYNYAVNCWHGYSGRRAIKSDMTDCVGFSSTSAYAELCTSQAYDIAFAHLFDLLTT